MIEPPHQSILLVVGLLGAIIVAGLAVVARAPGFILAPQASETAASWPIGTRGAYFDVVIFALTVSSAICLVTLLWSKLALSSRRRSTDASAPLYDRMYALVGVSFAAFVSSTYLMIAPFNVGVGLAASAATAIIFWLVLRGDGQTRILE